MRAGACMPSHMPVMPPSERPAKCALLDAEVVEQVGHVVADVVDRVRPGRGVASRRGRACRSGSAWKCLARALTCGSHIASVAPSELERTSGGPSPGDFVVGDHRWSSAFSTRRAAAPVSPVTRDAHPAGVDLEGFQGRAQPARGRAGGGQQLRQRPPLGVPGAGAALVLLHHRGQQRGHQRRAPAWRSRARRSRRPGCACGACSSSRRRVDSRTSATSDWLSRITSSAVLPSAPAATPRAPASSPIRLRCVCQGITGTSRPRSSR